MRDLMSLAVADMMGESNKEEKNTTKNKEPEKKEKKPVKKEEKPVIKEEKKEEKKDEVVISDKGSGVRVIEYDPIFDLNDRRLIRPKRTKRNSGDKEKKVHSFYLLKEEWDILESLADKYGMSINNVIRILILNAK